MQRFAGVVAATVVAALVTAGPAAAQDLPRTEISGGYQFMSTPAPVDTLAKGWYADIAGNFTKVVGVVLQVGGNYKEMSQGLGNAGFIVSVTGDLRVHQFMGGVRANVRSRAVSPFGEFLVGGINVSIRAEGTVVGGGQTVFSETITDSVTNFALQGAGGATFRLTDRVGARAAVGYIRLFEEGDSVGIVRVGVGAVFGV